MSANTRLLLQPLNCPRPGCNRPMQVLVNGGSIWLRCEAGSPKCGIVVPSETAVAWLVERDMKEATESAAAPVVATVEDEEVQFVPEHERTE